MANGSENSLNHAFAALSEALARLEHAAEHAAQERAQAQGARDAWQAESNAAWDAQWQEIQSENTFLKEDNLRLSNQLQQLQRDYLALQESAGSALARLDGSIKQLDLLLEH